MNERLEKKLTAYLIKCSNNSETSEDLDELMEYCDDVASDCSSLIDGFATELCKKLNVSNNDKGPFNSDFCFAVQDIIWKALQEFIEKQLDCEHDPEDLPIGPDGLRYCNLCQWENF